MIWFSREMGSDKGGMCVGNTEQMIAKPSFLSSAAFSYCTCTAVCVYDLAGLRAPSVETCGLGGGLDPHGMGGAPPTLIVPGASAPPPSPPPELLCQTTLRTCSSSASLIFGRRRCAFGQNIHPSCSQCISALWRSSMYAYGVIANMYCFPVRNNSRYKGLCYQVGKASTDIRLII